MHIAAFPLLKGLPFLFCLSMAVGAALGASVVFGDYVDYEIGGGYTYYPGSGSMTLLYHNGSLNFPVHDYKQRFYAWADSDFPGATDVRLISGLYRGQSNPSQRVCLGQMVISDEQDYHSRTTWAFNTVEINSSMYEYEVLNWRYREFAGNNKNLNVDQLVYTPENTGYACGWTRKDTMHHWTTWNVY